MIIGDYDKLVQKALSAEATQGDLEALWNWFSEYGRKYWNGECYDIDGRRGLYPVYEQADEDEFQITGYEIR